MNKDQMKGNWKQIKGKVMKQWGKITDDDLKKAQGSSEELEGLVQQKYGKSRDEARREVNSFIENLKL